jgi:hypothetical protein
LDNYLPNLPGIAFAGALPNMLLKAVSLSMKFKSLVNGNQTQSSVTTSVHLRPYLTSISDSNGRATASYSSLYLKSEKDNTDNKELSKETQQPWV